MFDRFTPAAKAVIEECEPIAASLGHNYIGTEHLLLALLAHESRTGDGPLTARGVTAADVTAHALAWLANTVDDAQSLKSLGVDAAAVATEAKTTLGVDLRIHGLQPYQPMSLTPRVFKVIHLAAGIAAGRDVEPRDLLQGMLEEDGGLGVIVLDRLGVDLAALHAALA